MKTWQKIVGVIIIPVLIIAHVMIFLRYLDLEEAACAYCAEIDQDSFFDLIDLNSTLFRSYYLMSFIDCGLIIMLFVWLWRKGGKS